MSEPKERTACDCLRSYDNGPMNTRTRVKDCGPFHRYIARDRCNFFTVGLLAVIAIHFSARVAPKLCDLMHAAWFSVAAIIWAYLTILCLLFYLCSAP